MRSDVQPVRSWKSETRTPVFDAAMLEGPSFGRTKLFVARSSICGFASAEISFHQRQLASQAIPARSAKATVGACRPLVVAATQIVDWIQTFET